MPRDSLALADWLLVVTSLPPGDWPPDRVLDLYRLRWQIELLFKRLKGRWHLGSLPPCGDDLAQATLLARLLAALLAERAVRPLPRACTPWWSATDRPLSRWRWQALLSRALASTVLGSLSCSDLLAALPALDRFLRDSPRRRRSQLAHTRAAFDPARHPPHSDDLAPPLVA